MIAPNSEWLSLTRMVGMLAYGISFAMCIFRSSSLRTAGGLRFLFGVFAGMQIAFLLDIVFDWRWMIHESIMRRAIARGVYDQRSMPQLLATLLVGLALAVCAMLIFRKLYQRPGMLMAAFGTLLSFGFWCIEVISFHDIDHVLYHQTAGVMWVSFVWVGLAALTCWGAGLEGGSHQPS